MLFLAFARRPGVAFFADGTINRGNFLNRLLFIFFFARGKFLIDGSGRVSDCFYLDFAKVMDDLNFVVRARKYRFV